MFVLLALAITTLLAAQLVFLSGRMPDDRNVVRPDELRGAGTRVLAGEVIVNI